MQRLLTPERVLELTKLIKEKLTTGLDEFNLVLVKQGGLELAKLFADACVEEIAAFSFPTSWTTWHATLIPKPGKDRCKLSGWREIWIQSHLWKLMVGAILPECAEVFARTPTRPWCVTRASRLVMAAPSSRRRCARGSSSTCGCGSHYTSTSRTTRSSSRRF